MMKILTKFLIQNTYPLYEFEENETNNKDSSLYLNINILLIYYFYYSL